MKELNKQNAIFSRFEIQLGPEKRLFYLEVVQLFNETKFYLIDYWGWPVVDFHLITEAQQQFAGFNEKKTLDGRLKLGNLTATNQ